MAIYVAWTSSRTFAGAVRSELVEKRGLRGGVRDLLSRRVQGVLAHRGVPSGRFTTQRPPAWGVLASVEVPGADPRSGARRRRGCSQVVRSSSCARRPLSWRRELISSLENTLCRWYSA